MNILCQSEIIGPSWADYLNRHPEHESKLSREPGFQMETTDHPQNFENFSEQIMGFRVQARNIHLSGKIPDFLH